MNTDGEVFEVTRCDYHVRRGAARFFAGEKPFTRESRQES